MKYNKKNISGRYKHYKGGIYDVYSIVIDEQNEKYVLYTKLGKDTEFLVRPLLMFFEQNIDDSNE